MRFDHATFDEVRNLPPARTVAVLPVGATEAHGPHLPLATDVIIAEAMAEAGVARLAAQGVSAVILPPFAYTSAEFAAEFPGTVSVSPTTVTALVSDVARSLAAQGFAALVIANSHLDPGHLASLKAAVDDPECPLPIVFPDVTRKPWALRLTEEFLSGACHAGQYETSIVLARSPELVRALRKSLAPNPSSLSDAIRAGKRTFGEADGPQAYFGDPARATPAEGRETIAILGEILAESVQAAGLELDRNADLP